jgi:hypothetical protein
VIRIISRKNGEFGDASFCFSVLADGFGGCADGDERG